MNILNEPEDSFNISSKKAGLKDEWYTPSEAIYPILKYIKPNSKIWCPFDLEKSLYVKILRKHGHKVINTHIEKGEDFFKMSMPECDYIISNPPYSARTKILRRLFGFDKPFMMLLNSNGLFDNDERWKLFNGHNFTLIYLKGRVNFMEDYENKTKSSPPFQSLYVCSKISDKNIIFENQTNDAKDSYIAKIDEWFKDKPEQEATA